MYELGDESGSGDEGTRLAGEGVVEEGGGSTMRGVRLAAAIANSYCVDGAEEEGLDDGI